MHKSAIRKKFISLREKKYSKILRINSNKLLRLLQRKRIKYKIIGGYYPFNHEIDILNVLKIFEKKGYTISLPKVKKQNMMNFFEWSFKDPLKINKFGIPETISKKKVFPEVLFIPLVAFDNNLNRLGYGGGYYDRYISKYDGKNKLIKIGLGFSFQKIKSLPIDEYDKKLDFILTEKDFIQ